MWELIEHLGEALPGFIIFLAGFVAGMVNVIVGAGTLVSFPILIFLGYPPLTATIANAIGIVPGSVSGAITYRHELGAQRRTVRLLVPVSTIGGIAGSLLLLRLSEDTFTRVIPWLIGAGTLLVLFGPWIKRWAGSPPDPTTGAGTPASPFSSRWALGTSLIGTLVLGIYGGYFSAAQGILVIALLGITTSLSLQQLNGLKNITVCTVNAVAAGVFIITAPSQIAWDVVGLIAAGSALGGVAGGRVARRLKPAIFRGFVVVMGVATVVVLTLSD